MSNIRDNYPALRYVDEYDRDTSEECKRCKGNCGYIGIIGEWACQGFVPKTNADRIRAMSDEELANFLMDVASRGGIQTESGIARWTLIDWLKQGVEE